jgi:O-methyltransferase
MLQVSENLRTRLPEWDVAERPWTWVRAVDVFLEVSALNVPCCMGIGTRRMLFQIIKAMGARTVLDIGTYVGVSALNYALAVGDTGRVVTVDNRSANNEAAFWKTDGRPMTPRNMMNHAGVLNRVEFVTEDSVEYMLSERRRFDFISIDGWHEDFHVYKEIELAMKLLNPGGLIFMDDVMTHDDPIRPAGLDYIQGPYMALQRHLDEGAELNVSYIHQAFGDWTANAFLLRKP